MKEIIYSDTTSDTDIAEVARKYKCPECECSYVLKKHFNYHIRKKHPEKVDELCITPKPDVQKPRNFVCSACDLTYVLRKQLYAHIRRKHPDKVDELCGDWKNRVIHRRDDSALYIEIKSEPEEGFSEQTEIEVKLPVCYNCQYCGRMFLHKRNIRPHIYKKHPDMMTKVKPDTTNYFPCYYCERRFKYKKNLNAHIRTKHPEVKIEPFRKPHELKFPCEVCDRKFKYKRNLYAHIRHVHFKDEPPKNRSAGANFLCDICSRGFLYKKNLLSHVRQKHLREEEIHEIITDCNEDLDKILEDSQNPAVYFDQVIHCTKKCPLCNHTARHKLPLLRHFTEVHDIQVEIENFEFDDMNTFNAWKDEVETETNCRYIKISCAKYPDHVTMIYQCHRSGRYKTKSTGCRFLKAQGSKKIGAYCPAQLHVTDWQTTLKVRFTKTHVGHENELCHVFLKPRDRESIAEKLALGLSADEILAEAADPRNSGKRESYINLKDIHNIKTKYNLINSDKQPDDSDIINVEEWISTHQEDVLYYKKEGAPPPMETNLKEEDLLLIVMNDLQKEMICEFGQNIVCAHSVRNANKYSFICTSVMVVDENGEEFPVAFLFSNRTDLEIYQIFFQCISDTVGLVQSDIFMSEKDSELYKAWTETMLPVNRHLFCTWQVLRDWKQNASTIEDEEKRKMILRFLEDQVLKEVNYEAFEDALNSFIDCSDDGVNEFRQYFVENYMETLPSWAYCFREEAKMNTNSIVEAIYRVLKLTNAKKETMVPLELVLHTVDKYLNYKKRNREVTFTKQISGTKTIVELEKNHKKALSANIDEVDIIKTEDGWLLPSFSPNEGPADMYVVRESDAPYCNDCKLVCPSCDVCIHRYSCSCADSSVRFNMCDHIHFLCNALKNQGDYKDIEHLVDEKLVVEDFNIIINDFGS